MSGVWLIGSHEALKSGLEASGVLAGCKIVPAAGNVNAVRHARACAVDVVITDTETPMRDDPALIEELRATRPGQGPRAASGPRHAPDAELRPQPHRLRPPMG